MSTQLFSQYFSLHTVHTLKVSFIRDKNMYTFFRILGEILNLCVWTLIGIFTKIIHYTPFATMNSGLNKIIDTNTERKLWVHTQMTVTLILKVKASSVLEQSHGPSGLLLLGNWALFCQALLMISSSWETWPEIISVLFGSFWTKQPLCHPDILFCRREEHGGAKPFICKSSIRVITKVCLFHLLF